MHFSSRYCFSLDIPLDLSKGVNFFCLDYWCSPNVAKAVKSCCNVCETALTFDSVRPGTLQSNWDCTSFSFHPLHWRVSNPASIYFTRFNLICTEVQCCCRGRFPQVLWGTSIRYSMSHRLIGGGGGAEHQGVPLYLLLQAHSLERIGMFHSWAWRDLLSKLFCDSD